MPQILLGIKCHSLLGPYQYLRWLEMTNKNSLILRYILKFNPRFWGVGVGV